MTGLQEVALSRQIGHMLLSLLHTETSKLIMLVFGQMENLLALQLPSDPGTVGCHKSLIQQVKTGSNGFKRIT